MTPFEAILPEKCNTDRFSGITATSEPLRSPAATPACWRFSRCHALLDRLRLVENRPDVAAAMDVVLGVLERVAEDGGSDQLETRASPTLGSSTECVIGNVVALDWYGLSFTVATARRKTVISMPESLRESVRQLLGKEVVVAVRTDASHDDALTNLCATSIEPARPALSADSAFAASFGCYRDVFEDLEMQDYFRELREGDLDACVV